MRETQTLCLFRVVFKTVFHLKKREEQEKLERQVWFHIFFIQIDLENPKNLFLKNKNQFLENDKNNIF